MKNVNPESQTITDIIKEGRDAFLAGWKPEDCPYWSKDYITAWNQGYEAEAEAARKRKEG